MYATVFLFVNGRVTMRSAADRQRLWTVQRARCLKLRCAASTLMEVSIQVFIRIAKRWMLRRNPSTLPWNMYASLSSVQLQASDCSIDVTSVMVDPQDNCDAGTVNNDPASTGLVCSRMDPSPSKPVSPRPQIHVRRSSVIHVV